MLQGLSTLMYWGESWEEMLVSMMDSPLEDVNCLRAYKILVIQTAPIYENTYNTYNSPEEE